MKMMRTCLLYGLRILTLLLFLAVISTVTLCYISPNINIFQRPFESLVKQTLHATQFEVSALKLAWHGGPVLDLGEVTLEVPNCTIQYARTEISLPIFQLFRGDTAPMISLTGGSMKLDLNGDSTSAMVAPNIHLMLQAVDITWTYGQESGLLSDVGLQTRPYFTYISLKSDALHVTLTPNQAMQVEKLQVKIEDWSVLPQSWRNYMPHAKSLVFSAHLTGLQAWQWQLDLVADDAKLLLPNAHVVLPFEHIKAVGFVALTAAADRLKKLEVSTLKWENKANFADAKLVWQDDVLQLEIFDGSSSMPMLWSWLWMLGEDGFQQWLSMMKHGRLADVRASLSIPWSNPLHAAPTENDIDQLTYHVLTHVSDADIALGLAGDFLWHTNADVEIDEKHLTAHMNSTDLDKQAGTIEGDFSIAWESLLMQITGEGEVDVGRLHGWLDKDAAANLHWGKAAAHAKLRMLWDVDADGPETTIVDLKPHGSWALSPYGVPLTVRRGLATWDVNKGLTLSNMWAHSPWMDGKLSMFLDSNKDWSLQALHIDGVAPLAQLTQQFALPITQPTGETKLQLTFSDKKWTGDLDFTASNWNQFLGYEKKGDEAFHIFFSGVSSQASLFPVHLTDIYSDHQDFVLAGDIQIEQEKLDFQFKGLKTPAFVGDFRLNLPMDEAVAWGMEVQADYVNKPSFAMYFEGGDNENTAPPRPWSLYAKVKRLEWESSYAEDVMFQMSSDKKSVARLQAKHFVSGDADLRKIKASFSMLEHGKFDLHLLEADGAGQHLKISGSVMPMDSGVLQWQGLVVLDGQFGSLMHQAELDKLFQHGQMSAVFLGHGAFKEGEPWHRGMQGRFRLLVEDGRMMQGGTLTRLLAAISLVDLPKYLIFQREDVTGEGLFYDKMQLEANFDQGKLYINELAFRSSALDAGGKGVVDLATGDLDLLLIGRPWQNIEALLGNIPLLGYILTGEDKSLLRKVYRIHGPASDALVDEIDPEDVGLPSSGLLEHLFSLPSQWFGD